MIGFQELTVKLEGERVWWGSWRAEEIPGVGCSRAPRLCSPGAFGITPPTPARTQEAS